MNEIKINLPYSNLLSKNRIISVGRGRSSFGKSRVWVNNDVEDMRQIITLMIKKLITTQWYQSKVYLTIIVGKPHHRGDAVNVIDNLCDCVKHAIGIDDKWFSIAKLDWFVTNKPYVYLEIQQPITEDCIICSGCKSITPFSEMKTKNLCKKCHYEKKDRTRN